MANNVNQSKTYRIYIKSTKEWVEVPEEFYREQTSYFKGLRIRPDTSAEEDFLN